MNKLLLATSSVLLLLVSCSSQSTLRVVTQSEQQATPVPAWNEATFTKPADAELQKTLSPMEYDVTQHDGTEPPFNNAYWNNEQPGIYVDIVSGEPLFSSLDKYDSKTGWPSFTKPLEPGNIVERPDNSLLSARTEVRSKHADSHLGHVFDDGPQLVLSEPEVIRRRVEGPTGLRYCMNSAAMRFIPKDLLAAKGYGQYVKLFAN